MISETNGNLALVRDELNISGYQRGQIVDYKPRNPQAAEIVPGVKPLWHVIETHPNHERIAVGHLIARRFGVFVPETELTIVRRGRKLDVIRLMFTGYIFIFVWDILRHRNRIESCPGVARIVLVDDKPDQARRPAVISDQKIDEIRAVENGERPLFNITPSAEVVRSKKDKKRWKKCSKKEKEREIEELARANDIVAVYPYGWSSFQDKLLTLDEQGRNQTLRNALGLS